jgi:GNAT superfamily N-acetyltransferase
MAEPIVFLTDTPGDEARQVINEGIAGHAVEQAGYWDAQPLAVLARDGLSGRILGGLLGRTSLGLLFIELAFLPKDLRHRRLGTRMLHMIEQEAARRGCCAAVLYTISFQAPGFYEQHGWREFGRIPCHPPGTSRIFMTKEITDNKNEVSRSTIGKPQSSTDKL